jgi:uncharacterized protein YsxB (DUF464 family)
MLRVKVCTNAQGAVKSVTALGHTSTAEGKDLVCAAASVLLQNVAVNLTPPASYKKLKGYLRLTLNDSLESDNQKLMRATLKSLTLIAQQNPGNIRITRA